MVFNTRCNLFPKQDIFTVDIFQNLDVCLIPLTVTLTSAGGVQSFSVLLRNELCTQLSVLPSQTETELMSAA